ncbi:ankyrin repeat-containing domain protein [Hyaloraphidium curvatum]|nr:ankyrin repeat-containing domain protein [Hyaloraphidium curvatum]
MDNEVEGLVRACEDGDVTEVRRLLAKRKLVWAPRGDREEWRALAAACRYGKVEVVKVLLRELNSDSRHSDDIGHVNSRELGEDETFGGWRCDRTPLGWACRVRKDDDEANYDTRVMALLLANPELDPNVVNEEIGDVDLLGGKLYPGETDCLNLTCLEWACAVGHLEAVKLLLGHKETDPSRKSYMGLTALHWAAYKHRASIVALLLKDERVDPNAQDDDKMTPLMRTSTSWGEGDPDDKTFLKDWKATVNALLTCPKVDPNVRGSGGATAFMLACEYDEYSGQFPPASIVKCLMHPRVDILAKDNEGKTVLDYIDDDDQNDQLRRAVKRAIKERCSGDREQGSSKDKASRAAIPAKPAQPPPWPPAHPPPPPPAPFSGPAAHRDEPSAGKHAKAKELAKPAARPPKPTSAPKVSARPVPRTFEFVAGRSGKSASRVYAVDSGGITLLQALVQCTAIPEAQAWAEGSGPTDVQFWTEVGGRKQKWVGTTAVASLTPGEDGHVRLLFKSVERLQKLEAGVDY